MAKTYDLKSAYRQIPVRADHLKFAYFSIYNHETDEVQIYRSLTLPFGATHSVYSFLRLARMLRCIACRGAKLMTTNFYDDFILASHEKLQESAKSSMELIFLFTGWDFAQDGKKATAFSQVCSALGVTFNLSASADGILEIRNTDRRVAELTSHIDEIIATKALTRSDALRLREAWLCGQLSPWALRGLSLKEVGGPRIWFLFKFGLWLSRLAAADEGEVDEVEAEACGFPDGARVVHLHRCILRTKGSDRWTGWCLAFAKW